MGQGYSITTLSAGSAGIDVPELNDFTYEQSLGDARFIKSIRARYNDGLVVTKVWMKPYADIDLERIVKELHRERAVLRSTPNALAFHRIIETSTNGYLVRQYIHSSLYDRLSTRPFLDHIEKKWLAFQLLSAVRDCHSQNIYHGDIKSENTMVTSWNWLMLTDFSGSFKPTYLPQDNPADFSFYFDTSGRRTCYLAPERFLESTPPGDTRGQVNWAMDIFSVGCVIAELFLETPIFNLSQLFKYRRREYDPERTYLHKIQDDDMRELISHMIQLDPESRYSADEYLNFWRGRSFPEYFYSFLHQYLYVITDPASGQKPVSAGGENLGESDDRIDRVYNDFDKISYFLGYESAQNTSEHPASSLKSANNLYPLHIDIPNNGHRAVSTVTPSMDDGSLIFLNIIITSVRSTARAAAKIRGCELILAFAERVTDEAKLDRIVPYLVEMLKDKADIVKVVAIRTLTQVLALVATISPVNAYIFPEYLLPRLQPFVSNSSANPSALLRATYASSLASLATTASRFMDMMQSLRADGALPATDNDTEDGSLNHTIYQRLFDVARDDLVGQFESQTKSFLTDDDPAVKRAFLGSISSLCVFFGSTRANDVILSHLNTYLNERDWMLKCAFFEAIVGVATYVGATSLDDFILPLMVQALTDPEEFVVERVLRSFSSMADLGLFQRSRTWELADIVGRFTMHPNIWIREAAAQFLATSTKYLSKADCHSIITPLVRPYLKVLPSDLSELQILDSLKKPLPRLVLDMAFTWAIAADKGIFWKPAQQRSFSLGHDDNLPTISATELGPKSLSRIAKNDEDENWLKRLRNAGMKSEDELKLVALREFIWRVAHRKKQDDSDQKHIKFNSIIPLTDLGVTPQTVFFNQQDLLGVGRSSSHQDWTAQPRTIEDALLDASTEDADMTKRPAKTRLDQITRGDAGNSRQGSAMTTPLSASPNTANEAAIQLQTDVQKNLPVNGSHDSRQASSESSPTQARKDFLAAEHRHALRHRNSAINLMKRGKESNKAIAETGTTSADAFGKVDVATRDQVSRKATHSVLAMAKENKQRNPSEIKYAAGHTYGGNDPNVLRLLDTLYLEYYPLDRIEFGPDKKSIGGRAPIRYSNGRSTSGAWRPEGVFVAMMGEHTGAINRVVVAPDHVFFLTGSDDGSVKIWDTSRLERNIAHRSRQTFKLSTKDARVTALTFVEDTHAFAATGSDGSVSVVKVDFNPSGAPYGRLQILRNYELPEGEFATWAEHFKTETQSILLLATNRSRIVAIELRSMTELYSLHNPVQHGTPTCFAVGRKGHWILLGTSHGVLELWDLRYRLRLKSYCFPGPAQPSNTTSTTTPTAAPINRIALQYHRSSRKPRAVVAGGSGFGDVSVWDVQKGTCLDVYRMTGSGSAKNDPTQRDVSRTYRLLDVDESSRPGDMLARFGTASLVENPGAGRAVQALVVGTNVPAEDETNPAGAPARHRDYSTSFILSAGPDWKVRFWDTARPETSCIVSGRMPDEIPPTYSVLSNITDPTVVIERPAGGMPADATREDGSRGDRDKRTSSRKDKDRSSKSQGGRGTLANAQQQQQHLLKSHLDTIMDVALLESPYGMVVSVDRSGIIYVFQ